ncbi:MAG: hypothetical protein KC619_08780 [Myxococcales bacterium]|nr:hypothetical protein [Myxococcales bacterium]
MLDRARAGWWIAAALTVACSDPGGALLVDLRTDLRPQVEFDRVEVSVYPSGASVLDDAPTRVAAPRLVAAESDVRRGIRAAELTGLAPGGWLILARLTRSGVEVGRGLVSVELGDAPLAVTVLVLRECGGVECPGDGSPTHIACLGGECVDPRCRPEDLDLCPDPECTDDADCVAPAGAPACAMGACFAGVCGAWLPDGCVPDGGDAGVPDAGFVDAGLLDAGVPDAGAPDAAADGGPDAGRDAGIDAGPPPDLRALTVGKFHSCAREESGALYCWGNGDSGRLGNGRVSNQPIPVLVSGLSDAIDVSAGQYHTCAIRSGGLVLCWGRNDAGQLGSDTGGMFATRPTPVMGLTGASAISLGADHSCAVAGGAVYCWGANDVGQLGDGTMLRRPLPTAVSGLTDAVEVRAGPTHVCARRTGGTVVCWGENSWGELGDGSTMQRLTPVAVTGIVDAVEIAVGSHHSCARRPGGEVLCWGDNRAGQLGAGTADFSHPTPVVVTSLGGVTQIAAGGDHSCAVTAAGSPLCWGDNTYGILGDGTTMSRDTPTPVLGLTGAVELRVAEYNTCARLGSGEVWCWGWNMWGQVGDGTATDRTTPVRTLF